MSIKFSQLAMFCALVEEGTIYAAAEKMYCVPSNITSRIKDLERNLNVALFHREQRKLNITPEGRAFYLKAKSIIEQTQQCQNLFRQTQPIGHLNIGTLNTVLEKHIQQQTLLFLKQQPEVELNIHCGSSVQLFERLMSAELDLIFVDSNIQHPSLVSQVILAESLYLVSHYPSLSALQQQASTQIFFSYAQPHTQHLQLKNWLDQHNIDYQRQCHIESYSLALDAVQQRLGFSIVPKPYLTEAETRQLHCIELSEFSCCDICMLYKASNQSPLLQLFTALFSTHH